MIFKELGICDSICRALEEQNYSSPTPIQEQSIPALINGEDLLASAQTGTGKTAAFTIPIIQQLQEHPAKTKGRRPIKALIVTPTRELAIQIEQNFANYSKYTHVRAAVIFGGVKQERQVQALRQGVDVLIATPGRLLDLMSQKIISLSRIEHFVLDEADRMLDMGFIHDIKKIIKELPGRRQSMFFSATMPPPIVELSNKILGKHPKRVDIQPEQTTSEKVSQSIYFVKKEDKPKLLVHIIKEGNYKSVLVFTRTKHGADKVVRLLDRAKIKAAAIHGNKSQNARQRALSNFTDGEIQVLVATDIAARGIDVDKLSLVINYELPNIAETYVHRIGRTGRAAASGIALSFCNEEEREYLRDIQKFIQQEIPVIEEHPYVDDSVKGGVSLKSRGGKKPSSGPQRGRRSGKPSGASRKPNNRDRSRTRRND